MNEIQQNAPGFFISKDKKYSSQIQKIKNKFQME